MVEPVVASPCRTMSTSSTHSSRLASPSELSRAPSRRPAEVLASLRLAAFPPSSTSVSPPPTTVHSPDGRCSSYCSSYRPGGAASELKDGAGAASEGETTASRTRTEVSQASRRGELPVDGGRRSRPRGLGDKLLQVEQQVSVGVELESEQAGVMS